MLARRLRRRPTIKTTLDQRLVFAGGGGGVRGSQKVLENSSATPDKLFPGAPKHVNNVLLNWLSLFFIYFKLADEFPAL